MLRPFIQELGTVREQLGAERARREIAENLAAALEAELEALRAPQTPTEAPQPQREAPETAMAEQDRGAADQDEASEEQAEPPDTPDRGESETVEQERIVLREPTRGPIFANAEPERRPWWRKVFRG